MEIKAEYKNDLRKQYLVLEGKEEGYQSRMLLNNRIPGLLGVELREWNNKRYYYYDITDCISLRELFRKKAPETEEICVLLQKITECCMEVEKYLLDEKDFLLNAEYIYSKTNGEIGFVCYPGYQTRHGEQLCSLMEDLMECLDYKKRHVVSLVYLLYSRSRQSECSAFQLLDLCNELIAAECEEKKENAGTEMQEWQQERYGQGFAKAESKGYSVKKEVSRGKIAKKEKKKKSAAEKRRSFAAIVGEGFARLKKKLQNAYGQEVIMSEVREETKQVQEVTFGSGAMELETVLLSAVEQQEEYRLEAMEDKHETIRMYRFPFYLGKERFESGYCFEEGVISRRHACIHKEEGGFYLTDLDSKNGTFLNGERMLPQECRRLELGDIVGLADIYYIFTCSKTANVL